MLHIVIGCAVVVGCWYQWILPERRKKAEAALVFRHLHPQDRDGTPAGRRELERLWRRAGWPTVPESPAPRTIIAPADLPPAFEDGAVRFAAAVGVFCVAVLVAYACA